MNVLDLFSGIGGFSLGLERAGMKTVAFCEVDKKARQVLKKHWPDVPIFEDVKTLTKEKLDEQAISVDVICGGFPCQDISLAGKGAGIEGERSGLWSEFARLIGELRPQYVIVENVSALLSRGIDRVLGDLASLGYDAEWHCIPASAVGAPHRRERIWILAYSNSKWELQSEGNKSESGRWISNCGQNVAYPYFTRWKGRIHWRKGEEWEDQFRYFRRSCASNRQSGQNWWTVEPDVGRVANGVPGRVDRLKQLGNAVVPQIPELIGKAIMSC